MFTGLIQDVGSIVDIKRQAAGGQLTVKTGLPLGEIQVGDSVAVNGACLTVTHKGTHTLHFDFSGETSQRTTLGTALVGQPVHLERAMRLSDRLDGHLVSGHVDGIGKLTRRMEQGDSLYLAVEAPEILRRYLVEKGCVAVAGVSLTVNEVSAEGFSLTLIPHTLAKTWLGRLRVGDPVNLEADLIAKYVERLLQPSEAWRPGRSGLSLDLLTRSGFARGG